MTTSDAEPAAVAEPARVLIVDDNPDHAFLTAQALRRGDFPATPLMAGDGAACLAALQQQLPDAIIMDYRLPDIDGLALLEKVRALAPFVPVVFVTGEGSGEVAVGAMKLGAADYVVKEGDYFGRLPPIVALAIEHFRQEEASQQAAAGAGGQAPLLDETTGLFGEKAFNAFAGVILAEAARRHAPLGLILVDLDGEAPGVESAERGAIAAARLRVVASTLTSTLRQGDLIGRHGPAGFAIIVQGDDLRGALRAAERIAAAVPDRIAVDDREVALAVAQGVATMPRDGSTLPELVATAERALARARTRRGSRIAAGGEEAGAIEGTASMDTIVRSRQAELAAMRQQALAELTAAHERGEIEGIAIQTRPGACPVCLDAARDIYYPRLLLSLPVTGCTSAGGCRCTYTAPALDPRRRPPPIPARRQPDLDIPRRWSDAALFGSEPKRGCKADVLAEYLDSFPLLPFSADLDLQEGEAVYVMRQARRSWERVTAASAAIHGPSLPLDDRFLPWLKTVGKLPFLPGDATPFREDGILYLTNWRLIFRQRGATTAMGAAKVDSLLLVDIAGLECLRDGIACRVGARGNRLVFFLADSVQVGLCIARAIRDITDLLTPVR